MVPTACSGLATAASSRRTSRPMSASTLARSNRSGRYSSRSRSRSPGTAIRLKRIMRRVVARDVGEPQPAGCTRKARPLGRIVLEHRQACRTAPPPQPRPGSPPGPHAGAPSAATGSPAPPAATSMSGLPAGSRIRSGSVLMNSPTICSMPAISGGRPATVTPNTTSSRPLSRPSSIPHAAWIRVLSVSPCRRPCCAQPRGQGLAQQMRDLLGRNRRPGAIRRRKPRALVQPGQCVLPGRQRGSAILGGDPRQIVPVRRHPRQRAHVPLLRIEREQLPHQHRHRPAVHQQVMVGQHQPVLIGRQPDQRKPNQRRAAHVEALGAVFLQDAGQPLLAVACIQQRQVDAAPGRLALPAR